MDFFKDIYVPMARYEEVWKEKSEEYGLNVIYFYRKDYTQWAQPFLIERIKDPEWVPIFVDDYVLILVKDNKENREVIERFRLPPSVFVITT